MNEVESKGYHVINIPKFNYESPYKLVEESLEFIDALSQGNNIMALVELSDLYGSLEYHVNRLGFTVDDLKVMSETTKRAFKNSRRKSQNLCDYLKSEGYTIKSFGLGFIQVKKDNINYNFYTDKVEKFSNTENPHSHQQDFISEILSGVLYEDVYELTDGSDKAYCGCGDTSLKIQNIGLIHNEKLNHTKGSLYFRLKDQYHTVSAENNTVTRVVKYGDRVNAFIIGDEDTSNNNTYDEDTLWSIVEEICKNVNL